MRRLIAVVIVMLILISLNSCSEPKNSTAKESATTIFIDSTGRKVEVPSTISKIAVSGPLTQIVLYSLAPEMLVGFCTEWAKDIKQYIPEEYLKLPVLGQLYGGQGELNLEELLSSDPDVIIDVGESKDTIAADMDQLQEQTGIPCIHIEATTEKMSDAYRELGKLLHLEERAGAFAAYSEQVYAQTLQIADSMAENKAKVLYLLGEKGLNVIARDSYHAEVINLLCSNVAIVKEPTQKGSGNEVDMEQILEWDPEIILFAPDSIYETVGEDKTWQQLQAIQKKHYYEVPFGPYNWLGFPPSVQRYLGMLWLTDLLYPELTDYDLKEEVMKYYEMFYHCSITDEQYYELIKNSMDIEVN